MGRADVDPSVATFLCLFVGKKLPPVVVSWLTSGVVVYDRRRFTAEVARDQLPSTRYDRPAQWLSST